MEKETIKEIGRYFLDISKILIGLALVTPFIKDENVSFLAIFVTLGTASLGVYFTNKGATHE